MDFSVTTAIILQFIHSCNQIIWGGAMLALLLCTHLFFTVKLRFIQKYVFRGIRLSMGGETPEDGRSQSGKRARAEKKTASADGIPQSGGHARAEKKTASADGRPQSDRRWQTSKKQASSGRISPFASLSTILAATIGIGNIVGVSTAIALGGPGAVLWCWLTGILGMATSYAECYLSIRYRVQNEDGTHSGGPMYVLERGLHCVPLGVLFALFTVIASLCVSCTIQTKSAAEAASSIFHVPPILTGFVLAVLAGLVLIGGSKSISKVCMKLVPAMGLFFLVACAFLLFLNRAYVIPSLILIVKSAFLPQAAAGGFVGSTILVAARFGVARGLFTNEAGLGSAPIAAAGADSDHPGRQALISMTAVFWDTIVLCAVTGVAIVSHIMRHPDTAAALKPTELTSAAFASIPYIGAPMLALSTIAFSFATILGWYYFGEHAFFYLLKKFFPHKKNLKDSVPYKIFQILYIVMVFIGSILSVELVWELSDLVNACMAFPNLLCLLVLAKEIPADPEAVTPPE